MVNNINGLTPTGTSGASNKDSHVDAVGTENQPPLENSNEAAGDSFELSAQAQLLSQLQAQISDLPEVDQDRVDALRDAINSGQFDIDSASLAQDIINFEL